MLKILRNKKTARKVWIVLALLIVPAFVFWGAGSLVRDKKEMGTAGKIFGKNVSLLEYRDAYNAVRAQAQLQFGDNFSELRQYLDLENLAWDRLVLLYEAKRRKIKVSDKEVIELIRSVPIFQKKGRFDNRFYSETLRYFLRMQPRAFEEQIRQNITISKLYNQITENIKVTDEDIRKEYQKLNEEISLTYLAALPADFTKGIYPQEKEMREYFENNSVQFKQPLSFNLEYAVSDSEAKIKEAANLLPKKKKLELAAKDTGADFNKTGLFAQSDPIPGIGWSPEILELIMTKLKPGQFSEPLNIDKKFYIVGLIERREPYIPEFAQAKDKVKEAMIKTESAKIAKEKIEACLTKMQSDFKINPKTIDFTKLAKEFSLKTDSTSPFKFGSYIEGIGASDNFWAAAQKLKENEFSPVISMPSGYYIIKTKSKTPIDEKKFASEKTEFGKKILAQKQQESFVKFTAELKQKAQMR
ncbi:MAG: SurA N-terminal domain-containing protein [Candidatus Omnitrophica bacterium]|nr:SurA N-terminal domain-containing protein [Candidatus Omnitrophota bacterium]